MIKKFTAVILCVLILLTCTCCKGNKSEDFNIIASFYPMYIFALNLIEGLDGVTLTCMAQQDTGCLHNYQLSTEDMKNLSDADLFVINGGGMESFLDDITKQLPNLKIVTASDGIELIKEEHEEHEEEHNSSADESGHEHEENAHVWLSVANAKIQVLNISSALKSALPEQAEKIDANEKAYIATLDQLNNEVLTAKEELNLTPVVSLHDAYAYLAKDLGLNIVSSVGTDDGTEPGTKELAQIIDLMKAYSVSIVLAPQTYTGNAGNVLVHETGATLLKINPITSGELVPAAYENIMRENLKLLTEAVN